jgi:hypothetical protein
MLSGGGRWFSASMPHRNLRHHLAALLTFAVVALTIPQFYRLAFPAPVIIEAAQSGGHVYFSANRGVVLFPRDCVILRWDVENINQVYLNSQPQIGSGDSRMCLTSTMPTLEVHFQDGSQQTYPLTITILSRSPLAYITLLLALIATALRWPEISPLVRHPLRFLSALVILTAILFLFITHMLSLAETIASANWLDATTGVAAQMTALALLAFLLLIAAVVGQKFLLGTESPSQSPAGYTSIRWLTAGVITLSVVAGIILAVNPRGMYFSNRYRPHELLLRDSKTAGHQQLSPPPDLVIMGSSRAFTLSPDDIHERTGLTAFNMSIEGGRIEDFLIQVRQMPILPKVLLIEVREGLPRQPDDIAARAPLTWIPLMSLDTALLTIQKRLTGLFDLHQFAESIYTAHYFDVYRRQPAEWPLFEPNGFASRPLLTASQFEQALLLDIGRLPPVRCDSVAPASQEDMNTLIQFAQSHETSLVFYLSPWHPRYYDALLRDDPGYQTCHAATVAYLTDLAQIHPNLFFLDFSNPDSMDVLDSEAGYYDAQHITAENGRRLIDHAADTLIQAYQTAQDT